MYSCKQIYDHIQNHAGLLRRALVQVHPGQNQANPTRNTTKHLLRMNDSNDLHEVPIRIVVLDEQHGERGCHIKDEGVFHDVVHHYDGHVRFPFDVLLVSGHHVEADVDHHENVNDESDVEHIIILRPLMPIRQVERQVIRVIHVPDEEKHIDCNAPSAQPATLHRVNHQLVEASSAPAL